MSYSAFLLLFTAFSGVTSAQTGVGFEKNQGQAPKPVVYLARTPGAHVFFTTEGVHFSPFEGDPVRLRFPGAATPAQWEGLGDPYDSASYYLGSDPSRWVKNAPVHERIAWRGVYPGVDAIFYSRENKLEYDLILAPGADAERIRLHWSGPVEIDLSGEIRAGAIRQRVPEIYQLDSSGRRRHVHGTFVAAGKPGEFRLSLGEYDRARPLLVDPVLESSSYIGGEDDDEVIHAGLGFIVGNTRSILFPGASAARRRSRDVFIRGAGAIGLRENTPRLSGTVVFGGSDDDEAAAASLVEYGSAVYIDVAGTTSSRDLPRPSTMPDGAYHGGASDGFRVTFQVSGPVYYLLTTQYLGGSGEDRVRGMSSSTYSRTVVVGTTDSPDLDAASAPQTALAGGHDAFYALPGDRIAYGYLGGSGDDAAYSVSLIEGSRFLIVGETRSSDFPWRAADSNPLTGGSDGFLALLQLGADSVQSPNASVSTWLLGGSQDDSIDSAACLPTSPTEGPVSYALISIAPLPCVFAGTTNSPDLRVRNAAQSRYAGATDVFAGAWDLSANTTPWLTYWGGSAADSSRRAAMNWAGDLFLAGSTRSPDLPLLDPIQPQPGGAEDGLFVVFERGGAPRHSTYFGGSGDDRIHSLAIVANNLARVGGATTSHDMPEVRAVQPRGELQDGFVADLGSGYLAGPSEIVLPKDGTLSFSLRGMFGVATAITYRTSDPSRVRLLYNNHVVDEATDSAGNNIQLLAYAGEGEVDILATSPGHLEKRVRARLFPSVFIVSGFPTQPATWANPIYSLNIAVRAIDPATGSLVGRAESVRHDLSRESLRWFSSDPAVLEIIQGTRNGYPFVEAWARRPGTAAVAYEIGGKQSQTVEIKVIGPELLTEDIFLGEDLLIPFRPRFTFGGALAYTGFRGTLTLRSEDPSRVLVATAGGRPQESATVLIRSSFNPLFELHGLSASGTVRLIATSSEFEGERIIPVHLEPAVARAFVGTAASTPLPVGRDGTVGISFATPSRPNVNSRLRPGIQPLVFRLETSDPRVLELSRLTLSITPENQFAESVTVRGLSAGVSTLSVSSPSGIEILNPSVQVVVLPLGGLIPQPKNIPTEVLLGKDLQASVRLNYYAPEEKAVVHVSVADPSAAVVSASSTTSGSPEVAIPPPQGASDEYVFWVQGLRGEGETTLRVRIGEKHEREIRIVLLPSALGVASRRSFGSTDSVTITALALEESKLAGVSSQLLRPGVRANLRFRVEGEPVRLSTESAVLDAQTAQVEVSFPLPENESYLVVEQPDGFTNSPLASRLRLDRLKTSPVVLPVGGPAPVAAGEAVTELSLVPSSEGSGVLTVRSLNPDLLLVSGSASDPGVPEFQMPGGSRNIYLHGRRSAGVAVVRIEAPGAQPLETPVQLVSASASVSTTGYGPGGPYPGSQFSVTAQLRVASPYWRPVSVDTSTEARRILIRSSNPDVVRVDQPELVIQPGQSEGSVILTALARGSADLLIEASPDIRLNVSRIPLEVRFPDILLQNGVIPQIFIGRNLQSEIRLTLRQPSPRGATARIESSDPSKLVISRSPYELGTGLISSLVPPDASSLEPLYFQALQGSGEVNVKVSVDGFEEVTIGVTLAPSLVLLDNGAAIGGSLKYPLGTTTSVKLTPGVFIDSTFTFVPASLRPGLGPVSLRLKSSTQGILSGVPESVELRPGVNPSFSVTAAAIGETQLEIDGAPHLDQPPAHLQPPWFLVSDAPLKTLSLYCWFSALPRDAQVECSVYPGGTSVTARSEDPSMAVLSSDPAQPGQAEISGQLNTVVIQAVGVAGTTEVVLSSPGLADRRFGVPVRPSTVGFAARPGDAEVPISRTADSVFTLVLATAWDQSGGSEFPPRAGLSIPVDIEVTPPGVVTVEPTRLNFTRDPASRQIKVRGVAPGSARIRVRAVGYDELPSSTLPVRVNP